MNKKITTYFLNLIRKKYKVYMYEDEFYYWITDGFKLFRILKNEMEINPLFFINKIEIKKVIDELQTEEYKNAKIYCYKVMKSNNELYAEIITEDNIKACVNKKYLEYYKNCCFKVKSKLLPVACYENNELVGCVYPIRIEED